MSRLVRRTAGPSRSVTSAPGIDKALEGEFFAGMTSEDDSGSDWEAPRSQMSGKSPAKKIKAMSSPTKGTLKSRRKASLSCLPSMPLDILFEIFCFLDPADLLSLARADKALREILMTRKAVTIWKAAMSNLDPAPPPCLPDFSEPAWANLIFGGARCQNCAAPNVHRVLFTLRKRLCALCLKKCLVTPFRFSQKFPEYDREIMDLIPYTQSVRGWPNRQGCSRHFWVDDIHEMAQQLASYQRDVQVGNIDPATLEDFKTARKEAVKMILSSAPECEKWFNEANYKRSREIVEKRRSRLLAIKTKFMELGYEECDLKHLRVAPAANRARVLNDQSWKRIRPNLESLVQQSRDERLAHEGERLAREREQFACGYPRLIERRKTDVKRYYLNYRRSRYISKPIKECFLLPRDWDVLKMESAARLIYRNDQRDLNDLDEDVLEFKSNLPVSLQNWMDARTLHIAGQLPTASTAEITSTNNMGRHEKASTARTQIGLSVFRCGTPSCITAPKVIPQVLFGWEGAIAHDCYLAGVRYANYRMPTQTCVEYDPRGSAAAASIASLLKLDPHTTLPSVLDDLDLRIVCMSCPINKHRGIYGRLAMSWREAVRHFAFAEQHISPRFESLDEPACEDVKNREGLDPSSKLWAWSCNLCAMHIDHPLPLPAVVSHITTNHLCQAAEGEDFFFNPKERHTVQGYFVFHPVGKQLFDNVTAAGATSSNG